MKPQCTECIVRQSKLILLVLDEHCWQHNPPFYHLPRNAINASAVKPGDSFNIGHTSLATQSARLLFCYPALLSMHRLSEHYIFLLLNEHYWQHNRYLYYFCKPQCIRCIGRQNGRFSFGWTCNVGNNFADFTNLLARITINASAVNKIASFTVGQYLLATRSPRIIFCYPAMQSVHRLSKQLLFFSIFNQPY